MAHAKIERWGKSLAIRLPYLIAKAAGLMKGEHVEIESYAEGIVIRRSASHAHADAAAAVEEITRERHKHSLGLGAFRTLVDEGRRE